MRRADTDTELKLTKLEVFVSSIFQLDLIRCPIRGRFIEDMLDGRCDPFALGLRGTVESTSVSETLFGGYVFRTETVRVDIRVVERTALECQSCLRFVLGLKAYALGNNAIVWALGLPICHPTPLASARFASTLLLKGKATARGLQPDAAACVNKRLAKTT